MSATIASVLLVFLVVSLTQPHLLDSRAAKPRHTHLLDSRAAKPRLTHLLDSRAVKPRHTHLLDSRAATVRRPSSSLTIPYQCWTSTRPLLEVTTLLYQEHGTAHWIRWVHIKNPTFKVFWDTLELLLLPLWSSGHGSQEVLYCICWHGL